MGYRIRERGPKQKKRLGQILYSKRFLTNTLIQTVSLTGETILRFLRLSIYSGMKEPPLGGSAALMLEGNLRRETSWSSFAESRTVKIPKSGITTLSAAQPPSTLFHGINCGRTISFRHTRHSITFSPVQSKGSSYRVRHFTHITTMTGSVALPLLILFLILIHA